MTQNNKGAPKKQEFSREELEKLIPIQLSSMFASADPIELERYVKLNLNIDEQNQRDILFAYSYYESLNERQRKGVKYAIANLSVGYLLNYIAQKNEKILDKIEELDSNNIKVIQWLDNQIIRMQANLLAFDERISEENKDVSNS